MWFLGVTCSEIVDGDKKSGDITDCLSWLTTTGIERCSIHPSLEGFLPKSAVRPSVIEVCASGKRLRYPSLVMYTAVRIGGTKSPRLLLGTWTQSMLDLHSSTLHSTHCSFITWTFMNVLDHGFVLFIALYFIWIFYCSIISIYLCTLVNL